MSAWQFLDISSEGTITTNVCVAVFRYKQQRERENNNKEWLRGRF